MGICKYQEERWSFHSNMTNGPFSGVATQLSAETANAFALTDKEEKSRSIRRRYRSRTDRINVHSSLETYSAAQGTPMSRASERPASQWLPGAPRTAPGIRQPEFHLANPVTPRNLRGMASCG